jgi:uncharacterized membrane protein
MATFRKYLVAGLLVWIPIGVTWLIVRALINLMDGVLVVLPHHYHPDTLLGFHIPGLGLLLSVAVLLLTGLVAANLLGKRLVAFSESVLAKIPIVRTIYSAAKQVTETVFAQKGNSFRKVLLIEYPRKGVWSIAFYTGTTVGEVQDKTEKEVVNVFLPTTPNPTTGFLMMIPREDIIELDMPVEDGIKLIMTLGVIAPPGVSRERALDIIRNQNITFPPTPPEGEDKPEEAPPPPTRKVVQ